MTQRKLNIALNASMLDEQPTGTGIFSLHLINHLHAIQKFQKWENLTVFSPTKNELAKNLKIIKLSNLLQASKFGKVAGLCRFIWNTIYYPIQARRYDVHISPTTHGGFSFNNQILTIHDLISLRFNNISLHQRFYFRYFLPHLVKNSKLIIAVSETTKQDIINFLRCSPDKIEVIYNGYDRERYFPLAENDHAIEKAYGFSQYILAVGPTYEHKNFRVLMEAYKMLGPEFIREYPLLVAGGKNPYLGEIISLVKALELENSVHFLGYVPINLMASLYREATLLIFPSLYEGFGFPVLEAMACGCPVLTSNTSSMPEVCGDAAAYFDPSDKTALAQTISGALKDKFMLQSLKLRGLVQCQKFSWEITAEKFKNIINHHFEIINPN
jgi:glycosyltransferase involved in cell wall biosynthesis